MPATPIAAAAPGLPKDTPTPGTYGQSVTELAERHRALTALYPMEPWIDGAMDHICEAAEIVERELFATSCRSLAEVAIKLRILADKAADGAAVHDCAHLVRQVAGEWEEAYDAELMKIGLVTVCFKAGAAA